MRSSRSARPDPPAWLTTRPFAHRGLHKQGRVENSRAAFEAAIEAGHGIELDVRLSRDGHAIVFHDEDLARLTGEAGRLESRSAAELGQIRLSGSGDRIETLGEILKLVGARVPLLIELKVPGRRVAALSLAVLRALEGYRGEVAVMSFNPDVGRWFARHGVRVTRGLVVTESGKRRLRGIVERYLSLWRAKPHFLAYDIGDLPSRFARAQRRRGLPVLTWTVRDEAQRATAAAEADQIIHEIP